MDDMARKGRWFGDIKGFVAGLFGDGLHAKRVLSLSNATLGVMVGAGLAVGVIGQALAQARGLATKHAIKQVDRLLSNQGVELDAFFRLWAPELIGSSRAIVVAMDWTDFDADGQATLAFNLVTSHGRALPLLWRTVAKTDLKDRRNDYEDDGLALLAEIVPKGVKVTVLADRGFGDTKLFAFLGDLGFDYVIRIRGNIHVTAATGEKRPASEWVGKGGRAVKLKDAGLTAAEARVGAVVCVHAKGMKEPWCLVASNGEATSREITNLYAKRWTIEPSFRDTKDLRFGLGMSQLRIANPQRRDRLLLVNALAIHLLTLLGTAGESLGFDRLLKSNTSKRRTHSLFRQGCMLYELVPNMPEARLDPLMQRFFEVIQKSPSAQPVLNAA